MAAQLFFDVFEAVRHLLDRGREKHRAASGLGHLRQHGVAFAAAGRPIGADGVDDGLGALAFFDRFVRVDAALVVVAIGDEHNGLAHGLTIACAFEQLVAAGSVDGVKQGRAAAGAQAIHAGLKRIDVVRPVLRDGGRYIEAHHEGAVAAGFENLQQELGGGLLFELKAGTDGGAGVDHNANAQRQIDLLAEVVDACWRFLVVEQGEVALLQVGNVVAMLVSDGEDEVHFIDTEMNDWRGLIRLIGCRSGGRSAGLLRCRRLRGRCLRGRCRRRGCRLLRFGRGK